MCVVQIYYIGVKFNFLVSSIINYFAISVFGCVESLTSFLSFFTFGFFVFRLIFMCVFSRVGHCFQVFFVIGDCCVAHVLQFTFNEQSTIFEKRFESFYRDFSDMFFIRTMFRFAHFVFFNLNMFYDFKFNCVYYNSLICFLVLVLRVVSDSLA